MELVPRTEKENELIRQTEQIVAKSNELITQTRSKMSLREMRLLLYLLSKIKPTDTPDTKYMVSVQDFSRVCGLTGYPKYSELKNIAIGLNRSFWLDNFEGKGRHLMLAWFDSALYNEGNGTITFIFHRLIHPFLFALKKRYTSYPLHYILPMRSQYSVKLYELLKCYKDREPSRDYFSFYLEDLKKVLGAETHKRWDNFKQRVLEPAIGMLNSSEPGGEINFYSDLKVSYRIEKQGRAVHGIIFYVRRKTKEELAVIKSDNKSILLNELVRPSSYADINMPGQMSMENYMQDLLGDEDGE